MSFARCLYILRCASDGSSDIWKKQRSRMPLSSMNLTRAEPNCLRKSSYALLEVRVDQPNIFFSLPLRSIATILGACFAPHWVKKVAHLKIADAASLGKIYPLFKIGEIKVVFAACPTHLDELHGAPLAADLGVERRGEKAGLECNSCRAWRLYAYNSHLCANIRR